MFDFDALLGACHGVFDEPFIFNPLRSQPGTPPYTAYGIYTNKAVDVPMDNGSMMSANQRMIGIRLSQWPILPLPCLGNNGRNQPGDQITHQGYLYDISTIKFDGKGSADLWLVEKRKL